MDKYGDAASKEKPPDGLLMGQTEKYVEYDRAGRVVKGGELAVAKSRYEEDVLEQNHKAVWGSWWSAGQWGYACCRSTQRGSYCTGAKGIEAAAASANLVRENLAAREVALARRDEEAPRRRRAAKSRRILSSESGTCGGRRRRARTST